LQPKQQQGLLLQLPLPLPLLQLLLPLLAVQPQAHTQEVPLVLLQLAALLL
jgi:hypothetical protein